MQKRMLAPDLALVALLVRLGDLHIFGIRQHPHRRDELLLAGLALRHPRYRLVVVACAVLHRATDQQSGNQQQQDQPAMVANRNNSFRDFIGHPHLVGRWPGCDAPVLGV
jgi:hypothetical protein